MYTEAKKKHLIEELLHVENEEILNKVEEILNSYKAESKGNDFFKFLGVFSEDEAAEVKQIIKETSGVVNPDDWK